MAFGSFSKSGEAAPMAEINVVPLIDVMLVLLVIFIITAPLLTHAVKIELPKASSQANTMPRENVQLGVKAGCLQDPRVCWEDVAWWGAAFPQHDSLSIG